MIRFIFMACFVIGLSHGLLANRVEAEGISIRSRMTLSVSSDRITVKLEASNTGDEAGKKIRAVLHIFDHILKSQIFNRLDAGKSHTFFLTLPFRKIDTDNLPLSGKLFFMMTIFTRFQRYLREHFSSEINIHPLSTGVAPMYPLKKRGVLPFMSRIPRPGPKRWKPPFICRML